MINNVLLLLVETIICGISLLYVSKNLEKIGLYIWIVLMNIISVITIVRTFVLWSLDIPLGLVSTVSIFTSINILIQKFGKDELTNVLTSIYISSFVAAFIMYSSTKLNVSTIYSFTNSASNSLFCYDLRILFSYIISLIVCIWINFKIYYFIRKTKNKYWISNMLSSIIVHLLYSILFIGISFLFRIDIKSVIIVIVISALIKIIIAIANTSIMYIDNKLSK